MKRETKYMLGGAAAVLVLASAAGAGAYYMHERSEQPVTQTQRAQLRATQQVAQAQPVAQRPPCDDNNIVGTVAGGAAGGLVGSRFGSGSGKTAATVGGVVGGAMLGNALIPTRGATCD